jgi:hypothetical protein
MHFHIVILHYSSSCDCPYTSAVAIAAVGLAGSMAHVKGGKDYRGAGALLTPAAAGGVGNSTALQAVLVSTRPNSKGRWVQG